MPNGKPTLGQRISTWFTQLYDAIGLKSLIDNANEQRKSWAAVRSAEDLRRHVAGYGVPNPTVLVAKGKELGLSPREITELSQPLVYEAWADPSQWLSDRITQVFSDPRWGEFNEVMGTLVVDPWLGSLTQGKIPSDSPELESVRRFLGNIAAMETLGSLVSTTVETLSAGQIDNAGRIFSDAKWMLGTCFTSWQSTSPIVQATILEPLQKLINENFRPADFTRQQWMDLYALGKIGVERMCRELARQGYAADKIEWLIALAKQQPSRADLVAMWNKGIIGDVTFAQGLRRLGYDGEWIDRYVELYKKEESGDNKTTLLGTLRKAFKEHLIGEPDFRVGMKKLGYSPDAIDLEIAVLALGWEVEDKTAAKGDIKAAYMADTIGAPEAQKWLTDAGFTLDVIKLLLDTWTKQKQPSYKQLNKAEILQAWGVNVLSRSEAFARLREVGYAERDATVLMDTYAKKYLATKPPETYRVKPSDIMNAWHAGVIEEGEAGRRLVEIGLAEEDVTLVFETFKRLHPRLTEKPPKEITKDDALEAWGRGVLTEEGCFEKLLTLGYIETDAGLLMDTYARRAEALPPEPTISQLIAACRRGIIDVAILSQKLTALGLREEDVQFYVSYATAPLPEKTRDLSRTDILNLWTQGRHNRAWALERLLSLNYSPEDAEDILWLSSPEIGDTETYVLWKAGVLDDEIAVAMWTGMGFTQDRIDEVLAAGR